MSGYSTTRTPINTQYVRGYLAFNKCLLILAKKQIIQTWDHQKKEPVYCSHTLSNILDQDNINFDRQDYISFQTAEKQSLTNAAEYQPQICFKGTVHNKTTANITTVVYSIDYPGPSQHNF